MECRFREELSDHSMAATSYVFRRFYNDLPDISDGGNIWVEGPTREGVIVYSVLTPIICLVGICGNSICLLVMTRKELKCSIFVYLSFLAFSGLCSSLLLFLSGLSAGILFSDDWPIYDVLFGLPLSAIFNTIAVVTTVMVTIDRLFFMRNPLSTTRPKFCRVSVARKNVVGCFIFSVVINIPTFFIFKSDEFGQLTTTDFFYSSTYKVYNWVKFILLGVVPALFLTASNSFLIHSLKKVLTLPSSFDGTLMKKKKKKLRHVTVTMILIIFFFLINEIPSILTSRTSASTYFFEPETKDDPCNSKSLETMRQISTVLTAFSLAADFFVYYYCCPPFAKMLSRVLKGKRRDKRRSKCAKSVQMNVFVIDKQICLDNGIKSINGLTPGKILQMIDSDEEINPFDDASSTDPSDEDTANNRKTLMTLCPTSSLDYTSRD